MAVKTLEKQQRVRRARGNSRKAEEILKRLDKLHKKFPIPPLTDSFLRKAKSFGRP